MLGGSMQVINHMEWSPVTISTLGKGERRVRVWLFFLRIFLGEGLCPNRILLAHKNLVASVTDGTLSTVMPPFIGKSKVTQRSRYGFKSIKTLYNKDNTDHLLINKIGKNLIFIQRKARLSWKKKKTSILTTKVKIFIPFSTKEKSELS